jgi:uncharacterized protein GlcG (DUF336 family)
MIRIKSWVLVVGLLTVFAVGAGIAKAQQAPAQQYDVSPASAMALPGDVLPPPPDVALHVPLGAPAGTPSGKKIAAPTTPLTFELALQAATTAIASCQADGFAVGVAVSDEKGQLMVALNADGAAVRSPFIAARKNLAVIAFKMPTMALRTKTVSDPSLLAQIKPNMAVLPGGLPILVGDRVVGAIATSGATGYEEEKCAGAGLEKIKPQLK